MLSLLSRIVSGVDSEHPQEAVEDNVFPDKSSTSSSFSSSSTDTDEEIISPPNPPIINIDQVGEDALAEEDSGSSKREEAQLDRDAARRVVELVEHYLSDDHLVLDMFLLKHVTRHREGYVSIKLLAAYKKLKRVARGWRGVTAALHNSKVLELSPDGKKVRRLAPLPEHLLQDTRPFRTVLAAGLDPKKATMSEMAEFFAKFGDVTALQIHRPGGRCIPEVRQAEQQHPGLVEEVCVLVEYDKVHHARHAIKNLKNNPECGMRLIELPRTSNRASPHSDKLNISSTTDGESAYYTNSDFSEPTSPINRSRPFPRMWSICSSAASSPAPSPLVNRRRGRPQHFQSSPESSPPSPYSPRRGIPTPNSSPEMLHEKRSCLHPPGSSPLPRRILPRPSCDPMARRSSIKSGESAATGSLSPWLRRRAKVIGISGSTCSSPSASPALRRRHDNIAMLPDNVTRFPRGPDGTRGFIQKRHIISACA